MKKLMLKIENILEKVENKPFDPKLWISSFAGIIIIRIIIEHWILGSEKTLSPILFYEFFNSYFIIFLLSIWALKTIAKIPFKKSANVLLWGTFIILIPPLVNAALSSKATIISFYIFDSFSGLMLRFVTFFGNNPDFGITYGIRASIAITLILLFSYALFRSKNFFRALGTTFVAYAVFFIIGTFPSWITIGIKGFSKGFLAVTDIDIAAFFLSPFNIFSRSISTIPIALMTKVNLFYLAIITAILLSGFIFYQRKKFTAFFLNMRFPQVLYHLSLLAIGSGLGIYFTSVPRLFDTFDIMSFLLFGEAVICAWLASVIANDLFDERIDNISNNNRPLIKKEFAHDDYRLLGWTFFFTSVYIALLINPTGGILLIAYQALAWLYSAEPLRLKRFPIVSTFVSALASITILFIGYSLVSPSQNLENIPVSLVWLLVISFVFSLPIKDFKDIEGDKKDGVFTIPVIFGEAWGKIIVGSGVFLSFLLSVVFLNESRLFWWALLFGGVAFWIVTQMKKPEENHWFNYRNIFWWMIGIVSGYGLVLVKIIFL